MKRVLVVFLSLLLAFVGMSAPQAGVVAHVGSIDSAPLGYVGCLVTSDFGTVHCLVAVHDPPGGTTHVTAATWPPGFNNGVVVEAELPASALRTRPDLGPYVVELDGTVPGLGAVNVIAKAEGLTVRITNAGCVAYPLQYTLASTTGSDSLGAVVRASGVVDGKPVLGRSAICDTSIFAASSGPWGFAGP